VSETALDREEHVTVRAASAADLSAVFGLLEAADLPTAGVQEALDGFFIAEEAGRLVGVAGLEVHGRDAVLRSVAVTPSHRGRGLGALLTERALDGARQADLRAVYLLTTTAEDYFPRHGFRPIPRSDASPEVQASVEFREACPDSAVAMILELEAAG
jgi:N-acetylglutamate synthase-like GNAT family acetyltransferase